MSGLCSADGFEPDSSITLIELAFDEYARQLEECHLALIRQFFEVRPAGMVQPGISQVVLSSHQGTSKWPMNVVSDNELGSESTSASDCSMEEGGYSETHETINIGPLVASILNPDPRQPARSIAPLSVLLGVDIGSQVIQMSRSAVPAAAEAIRQRQYLMQVKTASDRLTVAFKRQMADMHNASLQSSRAVAAQAKQAEQAFPAWKREFERQPPEAKRGL
ncbi:unnamed protein product [Rhizoctonia solani]|uniref:Uncharacterized protein n=1 Tax=Rhizoctonia solani TaxID=456999 RepID=A0A8H2XA93_9AGAM|nr:unnamed protein product [Rhizoctonia solani]